MRLVMLRQTSGIDSSSGLWHTPSHPSWRSSPPIASVRLWPCVFENCAASDWPAESTDAARTPRENREKTGLVVRSQLD